MSRGVEELIFAYQNFDSLPQVFFANKFAKNISNRYIDLACYENVYYVI